MAIDLLYNLRDDRPQRFAELLSPYVELCHSEKWRDRFRRLMRFADFSASPIQDLAEQLVREEFYHKLALEGHTEVFWEILRERSRRELPARNACQLTALYLDIALRKIEDGELEPEEEGEGVGPWHHPIFSGLSSTHPQMLRKAADQEPAEWLQNLLPIILQFAETFAVEDEGPPFRDTAWVASNLRFNHTVETLLVGGTIIALREAGAVALRETIDTLRKWRNYRTGQYLLLQAYQAAGRKYADEAVDFLIECAGEYGIAWIGGDPQSVSELIKKVAPHCKEERYETLEDKILNQRIPLEKELDQKQFGRHQQRLLEALPNDRIGDKARRKYYERIRKFGEVPDSPPGGVTGGFVGPPASIKEGNVEEMSDSDWIGAIQEYDTESNPGGDVQSGGGRQLAQVLRSEAEKDPERFSKLAEKLPDDALTTYFDHLLWGIADGDPNLEDVMRVVRRCHDLPVHPCGRFITQPIEEHPSLDYDENIVEIIRYYALEDPNPDEENSDETESSRGLLNDGINTVRGTTATAIAALIGADENRADWFWSILEEMVDDPSLSVRACVAQALLAASNRDEERAVNLFLQLCEINEHRLLPKPFTDRFLPFAFRCLLHRLQFLLRRVLNSSSEEDKIKLLATPFAERFFYFKFRRFFDELQPLICRMLNSSIDEVAQTGATQACLASLSDERAIPMAERCLSGSVSHRKGAAKVYANNLLITEHEEGCKDGLIHFFDDPREEVRDEAARCFSTLMQEDEPPGQHTDLIEAFIQSAAMTSSGQQFFTYLDDVIKMPPALAESLGERFLSFDDTDPSISHRGNTVGELVIRAYSQATDEEAQQRLLDLIDRFVQRRHHGVLSTLSEFERVRESR